ALRSDSIAITVLPLPPANPVTNVVGEKLSLDLQIDATSTRVGEPVEASITINGIGNVALWPPPEPGLRWPAGFRSYPAQTEMRLAADAGRIAGSKTFHFLAVPPLIALFASRRWRRAPAATVVTPGPGLTPLGRLEREFLAVLSSHVSDPFARDGDGLAPALRAPGVDSAVADHVKRLRDRLRA